MFVFRPLISRTKGSFLSSLSPVCMYPLVKNQMKIAIIGKNKILIIWMPCPSIGSPQTFKLQLHHLMFTNPSKDCFPLKSLPCLLDLKLGSLAIYHINLSGQSVFGADVYKLLTTQGHEIVGVFTIPDVNGKPDPLAVAATADGVPVFKFPRWRKKVDGQFKVRLPFYSPVFGNIIIILN